MIHWEPDGRWPFSKERNIGGDEPRNVLVLDIVDIVGIIIPKTIKHIPKN